MKKTLQAFTVIFFVFALCFSANAYFINSASDPALVGASVTTFDTDTPGAYTTYITNDNNLQIDSLDGRSFYISADYAGQYNNPGQAIENAYGTGSFKFSGPGGGGTTSAFGFNWGASDTAWTLTAYGISNNLLESYQLPITYSSNAGDFFGIAAPGIYYVTLTGDSGDYVFVDNFTIEQGGNHQIPEPATMLLLGLGLMGLAGIRRKFSN
jgi:hypothetical protein